jgi:hypothetical protein
MKSILSPEMKGVMFISGYRGKGKTFLAAHSDFAKNILLLDFDEGKAEGLHNQLNFGRYIPIEENEPLKRADFFLSTIDDIPQDTFTVVIIDNVSPLEKALQAVVYRDAKKYSDIYGYSVNDILTDHYGKARGIMNDLIGDAIAKPLHAKGVKLIIVTSHVKEKYKTPGKMTVQGRDRWQELSILTLILVDGNNPPVPSAIVQKESLGTISEVEQDDKILQAIMRGEIPSHTITPRLPARLPEATWQSIRRYLYQPANLTTPADGEKLVPEEVEPFSERLSKEQIAYRLASMKREAEEKKQQLAAELKLKQQQIEEIKKYIAGDLATMPVPIIVSSVKNAINNGELVYDGEITISDVNEWRK